MQKMERMDEEVETTTRSLENIVKHTGGLEKRLMSGQQELMMKRSEMASRIDGLHQDMESMKRQSRVTLEQQEKILTYLAEDVRQLKATGDHHKSQLMEFEGESPLEQAEIGGQPDGFFLSYPLTLVLFVV